jgi:hypothetical protein
VCKRQSRIEEFPIISLQKTPISDPSTTTGVARRQANLACQAFVLFDRIRLSAVRDSRTEQQHRVRDQSQPGADSQITLRGDDFCCAADGGAAYAASDKDAPVVKHSSGVILAGLRHCAEKTELTS